MQNNQLQTFENEFLVPSDLFAIAAAADERAGFIMKTYLYLLGAIAVLIAVETVIFTAMSGLVDAFMGALGTGQSSWLIALGAFMLVSWVANSWAQNATSSALQHAGLGLYIVAMSAIMIPLLYVAQQVGEGLILSAGVTTAGLFAMLTLAVFVTRKDFSFLRSFLWFSSLAALGLIVASLIFGFSLGLVFIYAMIALFCGYILYDTSNILHHYRIGQHVAASLALFASVVMLFWWILRLYIDRE